MSIDNCLEIINNGLQKPETDF